MIRFLVLVAAIMTAQPALAWDRMLRSDCQVAFEALGEMLDLTPNDATRFEQMVSSMAVTPNGWCEMDSRDPGLEDAEFDKLTWRADGIARWTRDGIPPLGVQLRVTGLEPDQMQGDVTTSRPPLSAEITLRQDPAAGLIVVERIVMSNEAGDLVSVSAVFDRVFLSSRSMMQISMGSATFKSGLFQVTLDGTHENPFGNGVDIDVRGNPQAQRDAAFDLISRLPDGVIDDASRAELTAYAGDLPKPVGTLEIVVNSERGLGLMQFGMAAYRGFAGAFENPDSPFEGLDFELLLDGVKVSANWTPAAQVAD